MDTHGCRSARFKMMRSSTRRGGEAARPETMVGGERGRVVNRGVLARGYLGVREHQRGTTMSRWWETRHESASLRSRRLG